MEPQISVEVEKVRGGGAFSSLALQEKKSAYSYGNKK